MRTAYGCPIYKANNPYWMIHWRYVSFVACLLTGLIFTFAGRLLWKFVHFTTGFGLVLTIFWTMIYPAYKKKGFRVDWMLWIAYPVSLVLSILFGLLLSRFPKYGTIWVAGWIGYVFGANLVYDLIFTYIKTSHMFMFWFSSITCSLIFAYIVWKFKR